MMENITMLAHEILCAFLIYTVFCRAVRTCQKVRLSIRLVIFALGLIVCLAMPAPLVWGLAPNLLSVSLLAVIALVQVVSAPLWTQGVPHVFYKPECAPRRRRSDDTGETS